MSGASALGIFCPNARNLVPWAPYVSGDSVGGFRTGENCIEIVQGAKPHRISGVDGCAANVRNKECVFQRRISRIEMWFSIINVQPDAGHLAAFNCVDKVVIDDDVAARRIHHDRAVG